MIISALNVVGWKTGRKMWENNNCKDKRNTKKRSFRNVLFFWAGGRESWLVVLVTDIIHYILYATPGVCWDEGDWRFAAFVRYGFFDLTMTKNEIKIESINWRGPFVVHKSLFHFFWGGDLGGYKDVPDQSRDDNFQGKKWKLSSAVSPQTDQMHFLQLWRVWGISHSYLNPYQHLCDWSFKNSNQTLTPHLHHQKHLGNVIETETVEPYLGTETKKAELEPCVVPKVGSDCYKVIQWAMKDPPRDLGPGWWGSRCGMCMRGLAGLAPCCWGGWWWMVGWMVGWLVFKTDILKVGRLMMESFLLDGFDPGWHPFQPWVVSRFDLVTWRK